MKNKILSTIALAASLMLVSCADTWDPGSTANGDVNLRSIAVEVSEATTNISKADTRASVDVTNYIVTINDERNARIGQWTYSRMPEVVSLAPGNYSVTVQSHVIEKSAWETPYYEGTQTFEITSGKITNIGVVKCTFQALKVTVKFADDIRRQMGNDVVVTVLANDEGSLTFTPDETRAGYFDVHPENGEDNTLIATFVGTVNNYKENIYKTFSGIKRGDHYIITFSLRTNPLEPDVESGTIDPSEGINVDTSISSEDVTGTVDNSEDVIDRDGTKNEEHFMENIEAVYDAATGIATFNATTEIQKIVVSILSDDSEFSALNGVDLLNPGSAAAAVGRYGLTPVAASRATAYTVDFSGLIAAMKLVDGTHTFSVVATDSEANTTEAITTQVVGGNQRPDDDAIQFTVPNPDTNTFKLNVKMQLTADGLLDGSADYDGKVIITCPARIKSLFLDINSDPDPDGFGEVTQNFKGVNFVEPGDMAATLQGFGLPYGSQLTQNDVVEFNINDFIPLIPTFGGIHTFSIEVTDNNNNVSSTSLIFEVVK